MVMLEDVAEMPLWVKIFVHAEGLWGVQINPLPSTMAVS